MRTRDMWYLWTAATKSTLSWIGWICAVVFAAVCFKLSVTALPATAVSAF